MSTSKRPRATAPRRRAVRITAKKPAANRVFSVPVELHSNLDASGIQLRPLDLAAEAMRWSQLVARRQQWQGGGDAKNDTELAAFELLGELGVDRKALAGLSEAETIEVCIPWTGAENRGWAERVVPWEFLLVRALRYVMPSRPSPTIVRWLRCEADETLAHEAVPTHALGVISCPRDAEFMPMRTGFERELKLIKSSLPSLRYEELIDPTRETVEQKLKDTAADNGSPIIHLLGVVTSRAVAESRNEIRPHVWLPSAAGAQQWLELEAAAKSLAGAGGGLPRLICFSFCDTGPRLAALVVAHGAEAAIGFQDFVTDVTCESFFSTFYKRWSDNGWKLLEAVVGARKELAAPLHGAGLVLWSRHSLLAPAPAKAAVAPVPQIAPPSADVTPPLAPDFPPPSVEIDKKFTVTVCANPQLNYSVLHNQQCDPLMRWIDADRQDPAQKLRAPVRLFSKFAICPPASLPHGSVVELEVTLFAGDDACTCRRLVTLDGQPKDVSDRIHVPLTSTLARTLRECLRTTVQTSVRFGQALIHQESHVVTLLAIDEWRDDGVCHVLLPSFVLPRDPAVIEIVRLARRCLCALTDDFSAGFDGYQQEDPGLVDLQVQSLWAALVQEWQLGYVNPLPSFSAQSQRLRSPSAIRGERAGTCIDLALLLAACIEYINLQPFIVLCPGHAFAGYWRIEQRRKRDVPFSPLEAFGSATGNTQPQSKSEDARSDRIMLPWVSDRTHHRSIVSALQREDIAALEATGLTRNLSFASARREGAARLRRRYDFDCLIDIALARTERNNVTPLPMIFV